MKIYIALLSAALAAGPAVGRQQQPEKRRIAVMDFDYATVMSSVQVQRTENKGDCSGSKKTSKAFDSKNGF